LNQEVASKGGREIIPPPHFFSAPAGKKFFGDISQFHKPIKELIN
jgi:hypothetical protein